MIGLCQALMVRRSALGTTAGCGGWVTADPLLCKFWGCFCVMLFLLGLAFYTKFEAWSVLLYIDTMGETLSLLNLM